MMDSKELEAMFGVTDEELGEWEAMAAAGVMPGEPSGEVVRGPGRPQLCDEDLVSVTFRVPRSQRDAIDRRAHSLNESRSEYLRRMTAEDVAVVA